MFTSKAMIEREREREKREMYDLLVDLGAPIEKMITDGLTVAQLKVEYEDMLLRQMKDWQKEKEYLKSLEKKVG